MTEAGGAAAIGLIKSLRQYNTNVKIVATDACPLAAGLHLADESAVMPPAADPGYISSLLKVVDRLHVDLILPTGDHDLQKLAESVELFESHGCAVWVSPTESIIICQNKMSFYERLKDTAAPVPATFKGPLIIKPNRGSGSRGIRVMELEGQIVQEYLPGTEYTVDVFCDMNSRIINHVIRERITIKAGISTQARVVVYPAISRIIQTVVEELSLCGPLCIQLREDQTGAPVLIECNPRLGGGTYVSTLAGINYGALYCELFAQRDISKFSLPPSQITVVRYFEELVL